MRRLQRVEAIFEQSGVGGLCQGCPAEMARGVLFQGVLMSCKERLTAMNQGCVAGRSMMARGPYGSGHKRTAACGLRPAACGLRPATAELDGGAPLDSVQGYAGASAAAMAAVA